MTSEESGPARVNIPLTPGSQRALARVQGDTGLKKVDVVNHALQVFEFVQGELAAGGEVVIRRPNGTEQLVKIFL